MYNVSKDYKELYQLVVKGNIVAAFVDYSFSHSEHVYRDICKVVRRKEFDITFSVRGMSYDSVEDCDRTYGDEESLFVQSCKNLNLGWIKP